MAVEVSSKAVLLALGVDFPKQHDVSSVFVETLRSRDLPTWFPIEKLASTISKLAELRSLAEYAYEKGIGQEYFGEYAATALNEAQAHVGVCRKLLEDLFDDAARSKARGGNAGQAVREMRNGREKGLSRQ